MALSQGKRCVWGEVVAWGKRRHFRIVGWGILAKR